MLQTLSLNSLSLTATSILTRKTRMDFGPSKLENRRSGAPARIEPRARGSGGAGFGPAWGAELQTGSSVARLAGWIASRS
eukprot:COSAG02_NODE_9279_length_2269_cov_0.844240_3_plen_80_part_00